MNQNFHCFRKMQNEKADTVRVWYNSSKRVWSYWSSYTNRYHIVWKTGSLFNSKFIMILIKNLVFSYNLKLWLENLLALNYYQVFMKAYSFWKRPAALHQKPVGPVYVRMAKYLMAKEFHQLTEIQGSEDLLPAILATLTNASMEIIFPI